MKNYLSLLKDIYDNGFSHPDRTGAGRRSVHGTSLRFDLTKGFPLVTTRKIHTPTLIKELLWFISGSNDATVLEKQKVGIWKDWTLREKDVDAFADKHLSMFSEKEREMFISSIKNEAKVVGTIGKLYGFSMRNTPMSNYSALAPRIAYEDIPSDKKKFYSELYDEAKFFSDKREIESEDFPSLEEFSIEQYHRTYDQLNEFYLLLRDDPFSSRICMTNWLPEFLPYSNMTPEENIILGRGALAPCHKDLQALVKEDEHGVKHLTLIVYMRSNDVPLGAPYNIAQYAMLCEMLAHVLGYKAKDLVYLIGDGHIYLNQLDAVKEQLSRTPYELPKLKLNPEVKSIFDFKEEDIVIENYQSHPNIQYARNK